MVKRVVLGRSGEEKVVDLLKEIQRRASEGNTTPAGDKVLENWEDFYWSRPDGTENSMREVDEGLEDARERIEGAEDSLADSQARLDEAEQAVQSVESGLQTMENVTLPQAVADLEAADQAAQQALGELDDKLENIDLTGELAPIREALEEAQEAVQSAQSTASEAVTAANAASQAALEAAGIAASKGRVIVSETEPQGEDRKSSNIWIQPVPDDPDTEIEEKAVTYVYLEASDEWQPTTSSELAQAAQSALDAREAAQQAQQRADTAVANASAAQAAAEAAQRTADQATLDARDAHNEAVAAQTAVDAAIEAGDSLIVNGSFEKGALGWPWYIGDNTHPRSGIVEDPDARTGSHTLRLTPDTSNTYPGSTPLLAVTTGQVLNFRGWWKHLGGDGTQTRMLIREHDAGQTYTSITYVSVRRDVQDWPIGEWILQEGDFVVPEGTRYLSFAAHATGPSTSEYRVDDLQVVDVTDARAAQARAEEAYEEAASKLDEGEVDEKIQTSANGKNSLTISQAAPSGDGVVAGDTWWQMDWEGQIFAQFQWIGDQWFPTTVRSEVIANLDVHKLVVSGSASMDSAVIDKLWVDGVAGKSATFARLSVASGNILTHGDGRQGRADADAAWGFDTSDAPAGAVGSWTLTAAQNSGYALFPGTADEWAIPVDPEREYLITYWTKNSASEGLHAGQATRLSPAGASLGTFFLSTNRDTGTEWTKHELTITPAQLDGATRIGFTMYGNVGANRGNFKTGGWSLRPKAGAVLIEDGAITAPKITVTEELSGNIASFMSVEAAEGVFTKGLTAANATLIGQTVVDDINVQGKLIGTDGVFTGTVDFDNVNVTGTALIEKLQGNTITGANITTPSVDGTRVILSNTARDGWPALAFETDGIYRPAALAAYDGVKSDEGVWPNGTLVMNSGKTDALGSTSAVAAASTEARMLVRDVDGGEPSEISVKHGDIRISSRGAPTLFEDGRVLIGAGVSTLLPGRATLQAGKGVASAGNPQGLVGVDSTGPLWWSHDGQGARGDALTLSGNLTVAGDTNLSGGLQVQGTVSGFDNHLAVEKHFRASGTTITFDNLPTTSSAGNVRSQAGTGRLYVNTSSRRFKKNIVNWSPEAERVLALQPRQWQHSDPANDEIDERWHVGFVAEEVDDLGLKGLVDYVGDGKGGWRPQSLNYERFSAAQQVVLQKHEAEIKELRERIALLESQIGTQ